MRKFKVQVLIRGSCPETEVFTTVSANSVYEAYNKAESRIDKKYHHRLEYIEAVDHKEIISRKKKN
jgi:hypothetical protein